MPTHPVKIHQLQRDGLNCSCEVRDDDLDGLDQHVEQLKIQNRDEHCDG